VKCPFAWVLCLGISLAGCDLGTTQTFEFRVDPGADDPLAFGRVAPFSLVSQTGETTTLDNLAGAPFVMGAIFTTCTGPCPSITASMRRLQDDLAGTGARLVSVSVDPGYDSPEVLLDYARSWDADPERWLFLTGEKEAVYALVRDGFKMAVDSEEDAAAPSGELVTHDTRLVAVDGDGKIRGWYDGTSDEGRQRLAARMHFLAGESGR